MTENTNVTDNQTDGQTWRDGLGCTYRVGKFLPTSV